MQSGPAPTHSAVGPGHTTVQLLVACSAVIAVVQLAAATSVRVFNGDQAGWWVAIQGTTVCLSAAFAGATASACAAWWTRTQEGATSTTPKSVLAGLGAASVAAMVFVVLCWAAIASPTVTAPVTLAVLLAALLGGLVGAVRGGGAVLAGLVAVFVGIVVDLTLQAVLTALVLDPALSAHRPGTQGAFQTVSAASHLTAVVAGTVAGCWWLSRRRQRTRLAHCLVVGLFWSVLHVIANLTAGLALFLVSDSVRGAAFSGALPIHGLRLLVSVVGGSLTAVVMAFVLRRRNVRIPQPVALTAAPTATESGPATDDGTPRSEEASGEPVEALNGDRGFGAETEPFQPVEAGVGRGYDNRSGSSETAYHSSS